MDFWVEGLGARLGISDGKFRVLGLGFREATPCFGIAGLVLGCKPEITHATP